MFPHEILMNYQSLVILSESRVLISFHQQFGQCNIDIINSLLFLWYFRNVYLKRLKCVTLTKYIFYATCYLLYIVLSHFNELTDDSVIAQQTSFHVASYNLNIHLKTMHAYGISHQVLWLTDVFECMTDIVSSLFEINKLSVNLDTKSFSTLYVANSTASSTYPLCFLPLWGKNKILGIQASILSDFMKAFQTPSSDWLSDRHILSTFRGHFPFPHPYRA